MNATLKLNLYTITPSHCHTVTPSHTPQEKNRSRESEIAKMDKLITFVNEPLLEKEVATPTQD